jgi:hypothetical protein
VNLFDGAEDHGRSALDGPADQVPRAAAVMISASRLPTGTSSPSKLVMSQQVSTGRRRDHGYAI